MWSLYQSLDESSAMRFHVYSSLVQLAGRTGQIELVFKDVDAFRLQMTSNPPPNDQLQKLLRHLHEVLRTAKKSEQVRERAVLVDKVVGGFYESSCVILFLIVPSSDRL